MNPNIAANQQRLFLEFLAELRPHLRRDSALPRRIKEIFARNRSIGSRDRKLYRELVYTALRFLPWIEPFLGPEIDGRAAASRQAMPGSAASAGPTDLALAAKITAWLAPELKPTSAYRAAHCGDWPPIPETLAEKSAFLSSQLSAFNFQPSTLLPSWFREHCPAAFESPHLDAINSRANVWVRIQCNDRNLVLDEFRAQNWAFTVSTEFPDAIALPPNAEVANTDAYRRGFIEIQDLGSQLVLLHAPIVPGGRWLDACAGAGGKTLQLARQLGPGGHVDATDIRVDILDELADRAKRARLDNISIVQTPARGYDGVLVDAPCSGSGTWRRQPHLKWYVKPETIAAFTKTQLEILAVNAPRVKPGGLLVYATCSLSHHENHDVVAAFLQAHPAFKPEAPVENHGGTFDGLGTSLLPGTLNTDGFYVALLRHFSP
jgi:16S rRNA (cytosine967-C5)-methyltransferase